MKRLTIRLPNSTPKIRLDDYLSSWLPTILGTPIPKSKVRTLLASGAVYVNRHRNKIASTDIFGGAVLEVYYDEKKLALNPHSTTGSSPLLKNDHVLFEDEWIILINKPAGIPTQPTIDPGRPNLFDLTKQLLKQRDGFRSPKEVRVQQENYLGLHHRLDRDTSGIMMFTKHEAANKGVADLFAEHRIQKTYQCLVWRTPSAPQYQVDEGFEVKNYLGRISAKNENARYGAVSSNGDPALTNFRVIELFRDVYWLEARPKTGRTHQIRVHTSEMGLPILGDPQYFPMSVTPMVSVPRLLLHAQRLEFDHPVSHQPLKIEAPIPDDFLAVLGKLRK